MSRSEFEQFRVKVLAEPALQEKLRDIDNKREFIETVVKEGADCGLHFQASEVEEAMRASYSEWVLRWV